MQPLPVTGVACAADYFQQRMAVLGIEPSQLKIRLLTDSIANTTYHHWQPEYKVYAVFEPHAKGIAILLYSIEGEVQWFRSVEGRQKMREYRQIRLLTPRLKADGSLQKYEIPKGQQTLPFFPPLLLEYYAQAKAIDVLYLTEGHFKAFKATMHGIACVGLPSITCLKDKDGLIYEDILKLIRKCSVQKVVWLQDGDCRNITAKEITDNTDLTLRPNVFYKSVEAFHDLLSKEPVRLFFAHINTAELEGQPKGIDDLLCGLTEKQQRQVADEFNDFRVQKAGYFQGIYGTRIEVTRTTHTVFRYFLLHDVNEFYQHHVELRPELKSTSFKFFGTVYKYDSEAGKCTILIPRAAADYFRVGDTYYQYVTIPDQWNRLKRIFERREKATILEDNSRDIFRHITKYVSFCNVPSHVDYKQVIHNCFNLYHPFEWEPEEGDCPHTLHFIRHLFGSERVQLDTGDPEIWVERWELGLDYLQLLYQKPQQALPILCLVSRERQTGKTTFGDWLRELYKENIAIVGNIDLKGDFNAHWLSKLIVFVDEAKADNEAVVDRLKSLSTSKTAIWNAKGKDQKSIPIFGKYILTSNREDDFIKIDPEEIRFWVIKVPRLPEDTIDVNLLQKMAVEIPYFIYFLNKRTLKAPQKERHWFATRLLETKALKNVVAKSRLTLEKQILIALVELFEVSGLEEITMPLTEIATIIKLQHNKSHVSDTLRKMNYKTCAYPNTKYFPRMMERRDVEGEMSLSCEYVKFKGRYFCFQRRDIMELYNLDGDAGEAGATE